MINLLIYEMAHKEKHYKRVTKGLSEALLMELYRLCTQEKSELSMRVISRSNLVLLNDALDYINKNHMDSGLRLAPLAERCRPPASGAAGRWRRAASSRGFCVVSISFLRWVQRLVISSTMAQMRSVESGFIWA